MADMISMEFDYGDLPAEKVLECEMAFQTACAVEEQATRMIGEQFAKVKENLKSLRHGNGWREWCEKRLNISHQSAENYINEYRNREFVKNFDKFGKSARWLLVAPNTPQEVRDRADAIAEAGGDVSVKTIKKLKADYEAERQARELFERRAQESQAESNARRLKIRDLETQVDLLKAAAPEVKVVEKAPADYEAAKALAQELAKDLDALKKKQADLVQQQVSAKLREREKEIADLDRQAKEAESRLASLNKQIDSYSSKERMTRLQRELIEKTRSQLVDLASHFESLPPLEDDPETARLWDALADMLRNAALAVDCFRGRAHPGLPAIRASANLQ